MGLKSIITTHDKLLSSDNRLYISAEGRKA